MGREVEVTGGVESGQDANGRNVVYLLIWSYLGPPDEKAARRDSTQVTLEDLVMKPERHDGKIVTVRGQFRGRNLFGDLPSASRQRSADWVLKDDVFAVWVSGKKAEGLRVEPRREPEARHGEVAAGHGSGPRERTRGHAPGDWT